MMTEWVSIKLIYAIEMLFQLLRLLICTNGNLNHWTNVNVVSHK